MGPRKRSSEDQPVRGLGLPTNVVLLLSWSAAFGLGCAGPSPGGADRGADAAGPADAARTADVPPASAGPETADAVSTAAADASAWLDLRALPGDGVVADTVLSAGDGALRDATPPRPDAASEATAGKPDGEGDVRPGAGDTAAPDGVTGHPDGAILDGVLVATDAGKAGCAADAGPASLVHLSALELKTLLAGGEDPYLINVKGASIGNIAGTDAVLVNDIAGIETLVGHDLCANIILYCQSGNTSASVATQLLAKGYLRVRDLAGGITAWKNAGYPTE